MMTDNDFDPLNERIWLAVAASGLVLGLWGLGSVDPDNPRNATFVTEETESGDECP